MKTALLTMIAVLSLATAAQAKTAKSKKTISGRDAVKEITTGNFLSTKDVFEGDDCTIEIKRRGHDLEILSSEKGKLKSTIQISESERYKLVDSSDGDDSVTTIQSLDKKQSITIEAADDAFDKVITEKDGVTVDCEMDM